MAHSIYNYILYRSTVLKSVAYNHWTYPVKCAVIWNKYTCLYHPDCFAQKGRIFLSYFPLTLNRWVWQCLRINSYCQIRVFFLQIRYFNSRCYPHPFYFSVWLLFSRSVMSNSWWPYALQHARLPCPSPSPRACSNSCPLSQWCHPTISSSVSMWYFCWK